MKCLEDFGAVWGKQHPDTNRMCVCVKICSKDTGPAGSDKVKNSNNEELYVDGCFHHGIGYSNNSHDIYSSSNTAADFRV